MFTCSRGWCRKRFSSVEELGRHMALHWNGSEVCPACRANIYPSGVGAALGGGWMSLPPQVRAQILGEHLAGCEAFMTHCLAKLLGGETR